MPDGKDGLVSVWIDVLGCVSPSCYISFDMLLYVLATFCQLNLHEFAI